MSCDEEGTTGERGRGECSDWDFGNLFVLLSHLNLWPILDYDSASMSTLADELMDDLMNDSDEEPSPADDSPSTSSLVPKLEENDAEEMEMDDDLLAELTKGGIKQSEALEVETVDGMDLKGVERVGKVIKLHGSKLLRETLSVRLRTTKEG